MKIDIGDTVLSGGLEWKVVRVFEGERMLDLQRTFRGSVIGRVVPAVSVIAVPATQPGGSFAAIVKAVDEDANRQHVALARAKQLADMGVSSPLVPPDPRASSPPVQKPRRALLVDRCGFEKIYNDAGGSTIRVATQGRYSGGAHLLFVDFEWSGVESRDGETFAVYRENPHCIRETLAEPVPTKLPSVAQLARAMFEADDDVIVLVEQRGERPSHEDRVRSVRYELAMQKAWERDELGARRKWTERASRVLARLRDGGFR